MEADRISQEFCSKNISERLKLMAKITVKRQIMMAELYNVKMMYEPTIHSYQAAVETTKLFESPDNLLLSSIYLGIGQAYNDLQNFKEADEAFKNA